MLTTLLCSHLVAALPQDPGFHPAVRLCVDGEPIRVEKPGYACPCWHDVDGDGKPDLVVGQFHDGKMAVYRGLGDGKFAAREWLQAEGDVAVVPGVW